ncbi:hypothetical protein Tco_0822502 [Tanacetum coccineum]|uniref:Gag-Pol polyprotein n=1 Tax=Tanacetum coccineum TaxID=301880 RepID=A0ABQ5AJJ1_9ASTR
MAVPVSTREPKHNVNQSVATSSKKTVATDSTVKKSRNITRKLYEQVSKTCSWWYPKYTPSGYNWKPKSQKGNVNPNVSMPLGNASRPANIFEHKTPRVPLCPIHPLIVYSFASSKKSFNSSSTLEIVGKSDKMKERKIMSDSRPLANNVQQRELLNGTSPVVSKSSAVHAADNPDKRQQHNITHTSYNNLMLQMPTTSIEHSFNTSTPTLNSSYRLSEQGETSSRHVDSSNMHTFYQHHPSSQRWTKDHPLEQVIGNPSQSVRTRRQLETDGEMCMFALTVSRTEPKNIKEAMADSAWIESM